MNSPRNDLRVLAQVGLVWLVAALVSLWIAGTTRIGPTVFELSERHGVHLGDLLGLATCMAWASDRTTALRRRATAVVRVPVADRRRR